MLKIKESVDLKELEKFGFIKCENDYRGHKYHWVRKLSDNAYYEIYINKDNKVSIYFENNIPECCYVRIVHRLQEKLYDLIKADMVEKVD